MTSAWQSLTKPERALALTTCAAVTVWAVLTVVYGGLRFDDFVNIAESHGALSIDGWKGLALDGRWQPLKRATYDLLARLSGLTFWPYILAVFAAHLALVAGVAACAHAIWRTRHAALLAGLVALGTLNLSAYSISYVATLHGIASTMLSVWCVAFGLRAAFSPESRSRHIAAGAAAVGAACLYKETAIMTVAISAFALWLAWRERPLTLRQAALGLAPAVVGVLAYLALRLIIDVPLVPPRGRYSGGGSWPIVRNALATLAHVMPWAAAALLGSLGARRAAMGARLLDAVVLGTAALLAVLPTLLLPWQSPNYLYAVVPVVALGVASLLLHAARPSHAHVALAALVLLTLVGVVGSAARRGVHLWGPYAEASISQWMTYPHHGGRIVWFDADSRAPYGGLVRTIGPGDRLLYALRTATGNPQLVADVCISVLVSSPYVPMPGDELYLHTAGRIEPIAAPPPGQWYCSLP